MLIADKPCACFSPNTLCAHVGAYTWLVSTADSTVVNSQLVNTFPGQGIFGLLVL